MCVIVYVCTVFIRIDGRTFISYKWFLTWCLNESGICSEFQTGVYFYCLYNYLSKVERHVPTIGQHVYKRVYGLHSDETKAHQCRKTMNVSDTL